MLISVANHFCESVSYIVVNYLYDIHKLILKHVIIDSSAKYFTFLANIFYIHFKTLDI